MFFEFFVELCIINCFKYKVEQVRFAIAVF
jgi:hypothetical protein